MTTPKASAVKGTALVLGVPLLLCALQPLQNRVIFQEDAGAEVLVSREASPGFEFPSAPVFIKSAPEGGDIVTDGNNVRVRGPVTVAGSASKGYATAGNLVVWDEYSGDAEHGGSFDVLGAVVSGQVAGEPFLIAGGPRFQARPRVSAVNSQGSYLVTWEEGPDGWGAPYRCADRQWNNVTDTKGPLHSWRAVKLALVTAEGSVTEIDVPMPSFKAQREELKRRPGAERVGVFYERPEVLCDPSGVIWLAYRHVHQREASLAIPRISTHVERGFSVYLAKLSFGAQADLYRLDERQRDGEQRLAFISGPKGLRIAFETGRSDRRRDTQHKGVRIVDVPAVPAVPLVPADAWKTLDAGDSTAPARVPAAAPEVRTVERKTANINGAPFTLLYGDLHRHTDLSLCFPFFDGSVDDAYRYAKGPGALDFVGLTDHARDLDRGQGTGRPWRQHVAAADRHHRPGHFVAFRAFERSQSDTDHNVIGLAPDADFLRPHRPPLTEFWAEFSPKEVLTIPHATASVPGARFSGDVWEKRDDLMRPVAEIFQGLRNVSSMEELRTNALGTGQKLGFIASSDHLSTSAAYACVWAHGEGADAVDRQPIFDALQSRRCYGATARIELQVTARSSEGGDVHWMGSDLPEAAEFAVSIKAQGSAPIERVEIWTKDGLITTKKVSAEENLEWTLPWRPDPDRPEYLFVRLVQTDGERAWSSPFYTGWDSISPSETR